MILLFNKEDELTLELGLPEEDIQEKYEGKLTKEMSGPEYEIVSRIMKTLVNRKITVPGTFIGHSGTQSIACSYKAATGFLYPLERGFIFIHKPPIHIRFDEVASVNFARSAGSTRSFDFDVSAKSGTVYTFVGIEKEEYGKLYDFVSQKKLRVKNIGSSLDKKPAYNDDMMGSDDEEAHDAYLQRVKAEGKQREEDEDEDSSEDEDFNPEEEPSEPEDEWDSNVETTDSSAESDSGSESAAESRPRKEKKEKEKKEKKPPAPRKTQTKKDKKDVDPNKPKRPMSAYFLWLNASREDIKAEHPGISVTDLSKKAGEMWRGMTDKKEWEAKAVQAKANYEKAMEEWKESGGVDVPASRAPKSKSHKKNVAESPAKDSRAGAGESYKSKEFISDSESDKDFSAGSDSEDDKPLKKKPKAKKKKKSGSGSGSESDSDSDNPKRKKSKRMQGQKIEKTESEEDAELPEDEDIESTPPGSGASDSGSASESD